MDNGPPYTEAEEEAQTLSDGPCNAYQDNAPLMCTQHSRKPVHNTRYMLQVCLQRKPLQHSPYSKSNWFTEFCKSLCLSQFTASFISVWAKASIAECIDKIAEDRKKSKCISLWGQENPHNPAAGKNPQQFYNDHVCINKACKWSFRRFTYGNLVTTSPSSKW